MLTFAAMKPFESYKETVAFLFQQLPMFQRVGQVAYKKDLTNTLALCEALGNPQHAIKTIHIAGTNGKGSTSHMLASILQEVGYKTGLYTSPHLKDYRERIKINGNYITEEEEVSCVNLLLPVIEKVQPSFFELTVAMALHYFAKEKVDVAVIEVGLGGRLDSTNVITPELSVITNIGWDHTDLLGDTLPLIAKEKAGIIKYKIPVVVSERNFEVEEVFLWKAEAEESQLVFAEDVYTVMSEDEKLITKFDVLWNHEPFLTIEHFPLGGLYQKKNITGVLMACELLNESGFIIEKQKIINGLQNVITNTGLKGRWQILQRDPFIVCDTGHNLNGINYVLEQIKRTPHQNLHIVWGMVKDKDHEKILALLPKHAQYYFCQANIPRAESATILAEKAAKFELKGEVIADVNEAIEKAKQTAQKDDMIFIGGSTFVVAEINNL